MTTQLDMSPSLPSQLTQLQCGKLELPAAGATLWPIAELLQINLLQPQENPENRDY